MLVYQKVSRLKIAQAMTVCSDMVPLPILRLVRAPADTPRDKNLGDIWLRFICLNPATAYHTTGID